MKKLIVAVLFLCVSAGSAYAGFGDVLKKKAEEVKGGGSPAATTATPAPASGESFKNKSDNVWFATDKFVKQNKQDRGDDSQYVPNDKLVKYFKEHYKTCKEQNSAEQLYIKCGTIFEGNGEKWCSKTDATCYKKGSNANLCGYSGAQSRAMDNYMNTCP